MHDVFRQRLVFCLHAGFNSLQIHHLHHPPPLHPPLPPVITELEQQQMTGLRTTHRIMDVVMPVWKSPQHILSYYVL